MSAAASPVPVPEQLAGVPAGALLAGLLEDIEIEQVSGSDAIELLLAEYRVWCRQTARFYRAVLETGLRRPFSIDTVERMDNLGEFAAEEARAALVWSRSRAERTVGFAFEVFHRLPALGEAMLAGWLDEPRARAFVDWTEGLNTEQAHQVCQQLLPNAARLTVGELIERIKRACLAIDPDWAENKYRAAVRTRRVRGFLGPDGSGTLTGQSQPAERVIAACERIDALARACKWAGDRRKIDHIRSDLFLGLTDGTLEGLTETEIIDYVLAHPYVLPDDNTGEDIGDTDNDGDADGGGSPHGDNPRGGGSGRGGPGAGHGPRSAGAGDRGAEDPSHAGGESGSPGGSMPAPTRPDEPVEPEAPAAPDKPGNSTEPAGPAPASSAAATRAGGSGLATPARAVPELRVQLGSLLGLNGEPAEVPGWGYLPAWLARHLVARMHGAEWRYAICDHDGHVVDGGLITTRPTTPDGTRVRRDVRRGGIVEIALRRGDPAPLRAAGAAAGTAAWVPVLTELTRTVVAPAGAQQPDTPDASRRTPGAVLRRWIQQRDRRCVHPCCRVPASKADQDHRLGFAHGGPTIETNLSAPCRHDHRLKDEGHWQVTAPRPGLTIWTSPLGYEYESRPPPAIPRPIQARTSPPDSSRPDREPTGDHTSPPGGCRCMLTPCPHDEEGMVTTATEPEHIAGAGEATAEPEILDDGEPPF